VRPGSEARAVIAGLAAAALLSGSCAKSPDAPRLIDDEAGLLSKTAEASVTTWHSALLRQYDIDYRVLTVPGSDDLSALAVRHFEDARVGSLSSTGRGLLLIADAGGERVRLEVARELEHVFVDSFVAFIEREQMAPLFAAGRVGDERAHRRACRGGCRRIHAHSARHHGDERRGDERRWWRREQSRHR